MTLGEDTGRGGTYAILRRNGWGDPDELQEASSRSTFEGDQMAGEVAWICSYVLEELDGSLGTVCIYRASSPEAIRDHARRASLPVDEIVRVAETVVVRDDLFREAIERRKS